MERNGVTEILLHAPLENASSVEKSAALSPPEVATHPKKRKKHVPALPGRHSEGETLDEALANIREAAELWLEVTADATTAPSDSIQLQKIEL